MTFGSEPKKNGNAVPWKTLGQAIRVEGVLHAIEQADKHLLTELLSTRFNYVAVSEQHQDWVLIDQNGYPYLSLANPNLHPEELIQGTTPQEFTSIRSVTLQHNKINGLSLACPIYGRDNGLAGWICIKADTKALVTRFRQLVDQPVRMKLSRGEAYFGNSIDTKTI